MLQWIVPDTIENYAAAHTTPLPPLLQELAAATLERTGGRAAMLSGHVAGMVLQSLVALSGARRVLELGTFTGFSALMMAAALPDDGQLITCDVNAETTQIAREFWARSPHGHKIELRLGPALETIKTLPGPFDFVFIDADKPAYVDYYEATLPLLAPHGVIVVDNTLRRGRVLAPENEGDTATVAFNAHVQRDPRTTNVLLTVRDGMMLIRRA
ncbi:MAG TPA: class I SAM-dependent methyltransferase [Chloroflexota bacterium]|jgi:caffeoyl-CoA O-methyltransferase